MFGRKTLSILFLLFASTVYATDFAIPTQIMSGHETPVEAGDLVEVYITPITDDIKKPHLSGVSYQWRLFEFVGGDIKEKRFRQDNTEGGRTIFFGAGVKDKKFFVECYVTYLYMVKKDNVIVEVGTRNQLITGVVIVGNPSPEPVPPGPNPNPPAPVPTPAFPDGKYKLAKFAFETAIAKVDKATREKAATALAGSFNGIIADIDSKKLTDPKMILTKTAERNQKALRDIGIDAKLWDEFFTVLQDNIYERYERFEMSTVGDFRTAWGEIAVGLSQVK